MAASLEGQIAIVTGAARGIGLGIARKLAVEGARVVAWDRDPSPLEQGGAGFDLALAETVDVTDLAAIEAALAKLQARLGGVDILINNAGISGPTLPTWEYPLDAWQRVLAVDLTGVFLCCRAVVPVMRAQGGGRIVNVASVAGKEGNANACAYSAAKAGVIGFTKSLAKELLASGVLVNCVTPAMTETELLQEMTADYIATIRAKIPMGRFCTVDEIAALVAWLASPACSFSTGAVFDISGGRATY